MTATEPIHEMSIMDATGDTKLIWNPNNEDEVECARRTFKDLKKKGYLAYTVKNGGDKGEVVTEFDAKLEKLILAPAVIGG
jgi:hypothetical protein